MKLNSANLGLFSSAVLLLAGVSQSYSITIGFDGTGVDPHGASSTSPLPYHEGGFVIHNGSPAPESNIFGKDIDDVANSGSDFLGWSFNGRVVLEQEGGATFSLNSFDAGHIGVPGGLPDILPLIVTGHLFGGGSVSVNINYTNPWQTFFLPATFTGLTSVDFFTPLNGGSVGVDNIVLNLTPVPESGASLTLLAGAALALGALKTVRRTTV